MTTKKEDRATQTRTFLEQFQNVYGGKIIEEENELYLFIKKDYYTIQTGFSKDFAGLHVKLALEEHMNRSPLEHSLVEDLGRYLESLFHGESNIRVTEGTSEDFTFWKIDIVEIAKDHTQTLMNIVDRVSYHFTHMINALLGTFYFRNLYMEYNKEIENVRKNIREKFLGPIIKGIE